MRHKLCSPSILLELSTLPMNMPEYIQSKDNPKLKLVRGLLEQASLRKKNAQTVLEGAHLIESFLQHGTAQNSHAKIHFL